MHSLQSLCAQLLPTALATLQAPAHNTVCLQPYASMKSTLSLTDTDKSTEQTLEPPAQSSETAQQQPIACASEPAPADSETAQQQQPTASSSDSAVHKLTAADAELTETERLRKTASVKKHHTTAARPTESTVTDWYINHTSLRTVIPPHQEGTVPVHVHSSNRADDTGS